MGGWGGGLCFPLHLSPRNPVSSAGLRSRLDGMVGWDPIPNLPSPFQPPTIVPTSPLSVLCSLDTMQGTREFERGNAHPGPPCKEPIVSGTPYSPPVPASLERQSAALYSALLCSDRSCQNTSGDFIRPYQTLVWKGLTSTRLRAHPRWHSHTRPPWPSHKRSYSHFASGSQ